MTIEIKMIKRTTDYGILGIKLDFNEVHKMIRERAWERKRKYELYHHGIKGQRWGVRRWQNPDGTFNEAGKKRYFSNGSGEDYKPVGRSNSANKISIKDRAKSIKGKIVETSEKVTKNLDKSEAGSRLKDAIDVFKNGDTDWMGDPISENPSVQERGKAALERLMYSKEQVENKKFYGEYDPFGTGDDGKDSIGYTPKTEAGKRGKAAFDVLLKGDTDWMGNHSYNDDAISELKNRGKAALERLRYSEEEIENRKFFGS